MENRTLTSDLQRMITGFNHFRNKYSSLKSRYLAQGELIDLQQKELAILKSRAEKLSTTLVDYQRCLNLVQQSLEVEHKRRRKDETSQIEENARKALADKEKDERIQRLERELAELRSKIHKENEVHRSEIESIKKQHGMQVIEYKKEIEGYDISGNCTEKNTMATNNRERNNNIGDSGNSSKDKQVTCTHPALNDDSPAKKRKKSTRFKWPELDVTVKKSQETVIKTSSLSKRKKLFQVDTDTVVDFSST